MRKLLLEKEKMYRVKISLKICGESILNISEK